MNRLLIAIVVLLVSGVIGYVIYSISGSQVAGYVVSCAGPAIALSALVLSLLQSKARISSSVRVGSAKNSDIKGITYSGTETIQAVESSLEADKIDGGSAIGVEWRQEAAGDSRNND